MTDAVVNNCESYLESISLLADGLLDGEARRALEAHLAVCPDCAARRDAFIAFHDVMPDLAEEPPGTLTPAILSKLGAEGRRRAHAHPLWRGLIPLGAAAAAVTLILLLKGFPAAQYDVPKPMLSMEASMSDQAGQNGALDAGGQAENDASMSVPCPEAENLIVASDADAAPDAGETMPKADEQPQLDTRIAGGAAYAAVAELTAARVPDELASYPRTDEDGRAEIVVPLEDFDTLWPVLQAGGAVLDVSPSGDAVLWESPALGGPAPYTTEQPVPEQAYALVIVYFDP